MDCRIENDNNASWPTAPQLFRYRTRLVSVAAAEPCVALIENDTAFSVLFAESAHEDELTGHIDFCKK